MNHAWSVIGNRYQLFVDFQGMTPLTFPDRMSQCKWCANGAPVQSFAKLLLPRTHVQNDLPVITEPIYSCSLSLFSSASKADSVSLRDTPAILYFNLEPDEGETVGKQLKEIQKVCCC